MNKQPKIDNDDIYSVCIPLPIGITKTIPKELPKDIQKKIEERGLKITKNQLKVVIAINDNASITRLEMSHQLGLADISVTSCILALKSKGLLIRKGGRRYGEWILTI